MRWTLGGKNSSFVEGLGAATAFQHDARPVGPDLYTVFDNGARQEISVFERRTELPLSIALLVDTSGSTNKELLYETDSASRFLRALLSEGNPEDAVALFSFNYEVTMQHDFTHNYRSLEARLKTLHGDAGTALYDAIYLAASEKLKGEVGRKCIVVITDGVDEGSKLKIDEAVEGAQKADTVIYSIDYSDPRAYGFGFGGGGGEAELRKMSDETGGHVYKVDRKHTLDQVFKELQDEMRSQYSIGFTPTNEVKDGGYRHLEVRLGNKDLKAQARKGYYAIKPEGK